MNKSIFRRKSRVGIRVTSITPELWKKWKREFSRGCVAFVGFGVWSEIISQEGFSKVFDPVDKLDIIKRGLFGRICDVPVYCNVFSVVEKDWLPPGDMYFFPKPEGDVTAWDFDRMLRGSSRVFHIALKEPKHKRVSG